MDTDSQLITAVEVMPGNAPDAEQALAVVEQTEAATRLRRVDESMGDCAYGDGATRQAFADAGRKLVAKVPSASNQGRFPSASGGSARPGGPELHLSGRTDDRGSQAAAGRGWAVPVRGGPPQADAGCPLRAQCVRGSGGRTVQLHPQERLLQEARELQASPAFQEYRTKRQVVEHRIARLMQLGLRQARYCGLAKTLFQACMAAAVANLTLLAGEAQAEAAAVAATATLVTACLVLLWTRWGRTQRLGAPNRAAQRTTTPPTTSARWQLTPPPSSFRTAGCRPGF